MIPAILGKKVGMTRVYDADGRSLAVTVVQAGPCPILQVRNKDKDGYDAVQLGFDEVKPGRSTRPMIGHCKNANAAPQRFVREIRLTAPTERKAGEVVTVQLFADESVKWVDVVGTSRGFGFQGVMKRHGFTGQPATHGTERKHRSPGGIGAMAGDRGRGRSIKLGKKMAGHMGDRRVTTLNLQVVSTDAERGLIMIKGAVPGAKGGYVLVRDAVKRPAPEGVPFPAALRDGSGAEPAPPAEAGGLTA